METIGGILELPLEILHIVLDLLDLASIYQLGAVCRSLHRFIHQVCKLQITILLSFAVSNYIQLSMEPFIYMNIVLNILE